MKTFSLFLIGFLLITNSVKSQNQDDPNLRVGHFYTETEGKIELAKLKKGYQTKEAWVERAEIIKQGILEGADLVPFPQKTPLNPRYTNERKYDGYAVKNVAIESLPEFL